MPLKVFAIGESPPGRVTWGDILVRVGAVCVDLQCARRRGRGAGVDFVACDQFGVGTLKIRGGEEEVLRDPECKRKCLVYGSIKR